MLTSIALDRIRSSFLEMITKACVVSNGIEREIAIGKKEVAGEYAHINMVLKRNGSNDIISQVRLYGTDGKLLAEKDENIALNAGFDNIMYRITIRICEV